MLPVWTTVNKAYGLAWRHRGAYLKISSVWMLFMFVVTWIATYMAWPAVKFMTCSDPSERVRLMHTAAYASAHHTFNLFLLAVAVISFPAMPSIAVSWHRLLLRDEAPPANSLRYDRPVIDYMLLALFLAAIYMGPMALMFLVQPGAIDALFIVLLFIAFFIRYA